MNGFFCLFVRICCFFCRMILYNRTNGIPFAEARYRTSTTGVDCMYCIFEFKSVFWLHAIYLKHHWRINEILYLFCRCAIVVHHDRIDECAFLYVDFWIGFWSFGGICLVLVLARPKINNQRSVFIWEFFTYKCMPNKYNIKIAFILSIHLCWRTRGENICF